MAIFYLAVKGGLLNKGTTILSKRLILIKFEKKITFIV